MEETTKQIEVIYQFYLPDNRSELIKHQCATQMYVSLSEISALLWKARKNDTDSIPTDTLWDIIQTIPLDEMD